MSISIYLFLAILAWLAFRILRVLLASDQKRREQHHKALEANEAAMRDWWGHGGG